MVATYITRSTIYRVIQQKYWLGEGCEPWLWLCYRNCDTICASIFLRCEVYSEYYSGYPFECEDIKPGKTIYKKISRRFVLICIDAIDRQHQSLKTVRIGYFTR